MRTIVLATTLGILLLGSSPILANTPEPVECGDFDSAGLVQAQPVIRVEPAFGDDLRSDSVNSCIVVTFGMKEKRGTDGKGLLAYKPKSVAWSEDVPDSARKSAERALTSGCSSRKRIPPLRSTFTTGFSNSRRCAGQ